MVPDSSTSYACGVLEHVFQVGELVLLPSCLRHEVSPFTDNGMRITVAFNAWVRYQDEPVGEPGFRRGRQTPGQTA